MLEKLLLAVTITFSLNLFSQVHIPKQTNINLKNYQQEAERAADLVVTLPRQEIFFKQSK